MRKGRIQTDFPLDGTPNRRALIERAIAVGAATLALPPSLARAEPEEAPPKHGGTLRLGLGGGSTTDTLEPSTWTDSVMIATGFALYNGLVENGPNNRPIPELAEHYEAKPGAAEWVLDLRPDIVFHNGKTFDADDAIYSLNLHRGGAKSGAAGPMSAVTEVKKLGKHQIQISLANGDADFPTVLTDYHIAMVPDGFTDWARPIGTGAFGITRFDPGVRITLKQAGPYWKPDRGFLDAVDITVIGDTAARMNALISGQVDAINRADPRTVSRIEKSPVLEIVRAAGGWFPVMAMMVDRDPYSSPDLREALKYAIDRDQMIKVLFNGYGSLGNDQPISASDPYCNTDLVQRRQDPDKAKFHFAKAGLSNPKIVLHTSSAAFNGAVEMANFLQSTAARAGISLEVKVDGPDGYFDRVWLKESFTCSYWGGRPAATQMLSVAYKSGAPWNETHWSNQAFDQLLAQAQAETDEAKRKAYLWDMQAMLSRDGGSLIPCFRDWLDAHNRKVGGHTPHSGFDMDNGRIAEKAYLKA